MTDLLVTRGSREPSRRRKGPNSCENIGCLDDRAPGKNKCVKHLACQRTYSQRYHLRRRKEQQDLRTRNAELVQKVAELQRKNNSLETQFRSFMERKQQGSKPG
jgi:hypothetical protein